MKNPRAYVAVGSVLLLLPTSPVHAEAPIQASGDFLQLALPIFALGTTVGHRNENDGRRWDREGTIEFAKSAAVTLAATYALKYSLDTPRPDGGRHGMPSGHAAISFSSAEFLRKRYGWEWGIPSYAAATWVAYSRVESHQHSPEDVIVGAGIGFLSSYLFTKPYHGWHPSVTADAHSIGIRLVREW